MKYITKLQKLRKNYEKFNLQKNKLTNIRSRSINKTDILNIFVEKITKITLEKDFRITFELYQKNQLYFQDIMKSKFLLLLLFL